MSIRVKPVIPYPALLIEKGDQKAVIIADLHIGWSLELTSKGIYLPSQTFRLKNKLKELAEKVDAHSLFILGDVKHTVALADISEWKDVPEFLEEALKYFDDVTIVPGNHDGDLEPLTPREVEIVDTRGVLLWEELALIHGHTWPKPSLLKARLLVMGHIHPTILFRDNFGFRFSKPVWLHIPVDKNKLIRIYSKQYKKLHEDKNIINIEKIIVLPSFNDILGGQPVNRITNPPKHFISPLLRSGSALIEDSEIYMLDGVYLGKLSFLLKNF